MARSIQIEFDQVVVSAVAPGERGRTEAEGEDGIGFGDTGDLLKRSAAQSLTDLSEGGSLGIREAHTGGKVGSEDAILGCEVLILEQEFLIDQAGDVRQQASPFGVWHEEHPS